MDRTDRNGPRPRQSAHVPLRTCVGCRRTESRSVLLRVTAREDDTGAIQVVPDVRRRLGGRGAWLHPEPGCLEQAVRRRAFARALRVRAPIDVEPLTAYLERLQS
ncbi:MAG: YlxR family protein [Actinomycetales bacterium]|nr:YlxR family protein [Tetrasphaera sp.]NLW98415.1 YlxR family protein [Actinomycetales bacterium]